MAGHSKFANIKHRKERQDAKKGKIFTKLGREIAVAVKAGGPDPELNTKLKDVVAKCKANNMPNDTISRSIKKAAGEGDNVSYESIVYEGYGPNGVAVIVECLTDNKNRTAANVRHAFTKGGGNMGTSGCVSFMFDKKGEIIIEKSDGMDEDEMMMLALDAGAEDFEAEEEGYVVITTPEDFGAVSDAINAVDIQPISAEVKMIPQTTTELTSDEDLKKMQKMLDLLEDDDDVQDVWHNWAE
ncbi:YebC/PmpR family DNA-binding transcriptional regulator [Vallitalea okinawensis]|uniref:YebC/PmpR family DNA-binding transcriptional regulator n=1 Tax=Vallitalea okinawensis TaxID=2078660 RepID=UPI000CFB2402|nr:YebC/PmpR family DNA-binding transcriptional regulator [Vallitalea okinawensis]